MSQLFIYCSVVLLSGWGLSFLLAREVELKRKISPSALVYSLLAVSMPTAMAFALSSQAERESLLSQFNFHFRGAHLGLAVLAPLGIALAGHAGGILGSFERSISWLPSSTSIKASVGFLPICLLWGVLEEIGWRGFLVPRMSAHFPALGAAALVGLVWGLWHTPQMFFSDLPGDGAWKNRPMTGATLWVLQCISLGTILGWLQLKTGSFILPTLAHALNNFLGKISEPSFSGKANPMWTGTSGLAGIAASASIAGFLITQGI